MMLLLLVCVFLKQNTLVNKNTWITQVFLFTSFNISLHLFPEDRPRECMCYYLCMSYRRVNFVQNEFYHIYNRGNSKQVIFKDDSDKIRFQEMLYLSNSTDPISLKDARRKKGGVYGHSHDEQLVAIGAYCLMNNHFHILLTPLVEDGVSTFMKKLSTGYVMYFNRKYDRTGSLFENRYKSKFIDSDQYLKYIFSYIHLNILSLKESDQSVRLRFSDKLLEKAVDYRFSSLQDHINDDREEASILLKDSFPQYFETKKLLTELKDWITYDAE